MVQRDKPAGPSRSLRGRSASTKKPPRQSAATAPCKGPRPGAATGVAGLLPGQLGLLPGDERAHLLLQRRQGHRAEVEDCVVERALVGRVARFSFGLGVQDALVFITVVEGV